MSRPNGRIRRRLAATAALVTLSVVLAFCIPLSLYVRSVAHDRAVDSAEAQSRSLAAVLAPVAARGDIGRLVHEANLAAPSPAVAVLADGALVGPHVAARLAIPPGVSAGRSVTVPTGSGGVRVWVPVRGDGPTRAVVVTVPAALVDEGVTRNWVLLYSGGALIVVVAVLLADALGRSIVRPIKDLDRVARRLKDGDLDARVVPSGPVEVAEVGATLNGLADRILQLLEQARTAAADLSHRLRTPLTALRLDLERLEQPAARARLQGDLDSVEAALTLLINETRRGSPATAQRTELVATVRARLAFWSLLARSQRRPVSVDLPDDRAVVAIGRDELVAAIDAVAGNVFRHTPVGTGFSVGLERALGEPGVLVLSIENDPPASGADRAAAPPEQASSFRARGNARAAGSGVGLDIVRRTVQGVGGRAEAGATPEGGFRVVISLPEAGSKGRPEAGA